MEERIQTEISSENPVKDSIADVTVDEINGGLSSLTNNVKELDIKFENWKTNVDPTLSNLQSELSDSLLSLSNDIKLLEAKFDVWQSNVEPMLATAQTAMQYDNYVLTFLAIIIAMASFAFQKWASKSKQEAIEEASDAVERTIAKGILPKGSGIRKKLLDSILKSDEFTFAVKEANKFIDASDDVDEELLEELEDSSEQIGEDNIKRAKEQEESEKTSGEKSKSDILNKDNTSDLGKERKND